MTDPPVHPLFPVGWSERVEALLSPLLGEGLSPARVVGVDRGRSRLATPSGESSAPAPGTAVGDWVALDGAEVRHVAPRWSELARLDPEGSRQVLAANLDLVMIAAPADRLSLARVEREVVIAWDSGARPVVILTKLDLAPPGIVEELAARLGSVDIVATSAVAGRGLEALRLLLVHPTTAALLGPSGAGKSTLINALLGEERLAVATVRCEDRRGRHTTTSRQLVPLPAGGSLIDMPGLRSLGTDASEASVGAAFPDIEELAAGCRFSDCAHDVEPGCAVVVSVSAGALDPERVMSYRKLVAEIAHERRRADALARKADSRVAKAQTRELRRMYRDRDR